MVRGWGCSAKSTNNFFEDWAIVFELFSRKHAVARAAIATAAAVGFSSCGGLEPPETTSEQTAATEASEKLKIVASYSVICNLAEEIAAEFAEVKCLIAPDRDPHTYEATPSDRKAIDEAEVVFYAGLNFEPAIVSMAQASDSSSPKLALHELAVQQTIEVSEDGEVEPDPHIWHDVENGIEMANLIRDTLADVDPDNAALFQQNADALIRELQELDSWIPIQIETIPEGQRRLVTTHDAMGYFAQAYGLTVEGTLLGVSTEEEPTAAEVNRLATTIREKGIPTIFAELTSDDRVLQTVADEAGVTISENVLLADGLGAVDTPLGTYTGMLVYNTCTIVTGLGGECDDPTP
ncbi:ABC-type metal ion transport system, periplasmic component/surface adhesin [Rubidibacter lacunae KORDI 51-2]|uniref:ABC-type metal ion transport system, periplasmic component/surface adhesin n=1 Tax=Rubidibacter lacunae KORDI 51-2 TaxID=582515 RepID=U5DPY5_9CHRO|nr:ABC-type metal ion transport system, periplasmic component/surface adhesin [Rubidibacter lacunae KORDI 51-2]